MLAAVDGERRLTDLRHVASSCTPLPPPSSMGTTALTSWLRQRIDEAEQETGDEERSRRLESDAEAVQVLTIHRSKGLEFPIVYYPGLWEPGYIPSGARPIFFHDPAAGDARTIDVGLEGPDFRDHQKQHRIEQRGEDLRLAYVALTRAQHQAVIWWAGSWDSRNSALGRLLFARDADGNVAAGGSSTPSDAAAVARFEQLAASAAGCIRVERSTLALPTAWSDSPREPAQLSAARFDRSLDWRWRRTSYSDIAAGTYEARVASEPEEPLRDDELPPQPGAAAVPEGDDEAAALRGTPSLLAAMPVGMQVGTFVHQVLEAVDFAAPDLETELAGHVAAEQARRKLEVGEPALVGAGLKAVIETPLGELLGGIRLRDLRRADRLDELSFELPLVGGDAPTGTLTLAALAAVLREHTRPGDALADYLPRLEDQALRQHLRGYLTGSIDLVVRVPGAGGEPRFAVLDYKTNWLAGADEPLSAWHHRPAALAAEMERGHYWLQALLYTAALHRYLRWRLPGYDAERNLAGVLYLFVRGMTGAATPTVAGAPCGVFGWRPSKPLVEALSDALDQGAPA